MKCPTCPISMWYYDTMEPEGGGQDKAKEPLALDMYIQRERTYPSWWHCCCEAGRPFLLGRGGGGMDSGRILKLRKMIDNGNADGFYSWKPWKRLRASVLRLDHNECQLCKAKGRYSRAEIVHHVKHLKDRPDLALSIWDGEERQLVSVCRRCHEELHPESMEGRFPAAKREAVPEERWD